MIQKVLTFRVDLTTTNEEGAKKNIGVAQATLDIGNNNNFNLNIYLNPGTVVDAEELQKQIDSFIEYLKKEMVINKTLYHI